MNDRTLLTKLLLLEFFSQLPLEYDYLDTTAPWTSIPRDLSGVPPAFASIRIWVDARTKSRTDESRVSGRIMTQIEGLVFVCH